MTVLITGASGYIGSKLAERLADDGVALRLAGRNPKALERHGRGAEAIRMDVLDPPTIAAAVEGVSTAYYLIHSMGETESGFAERDLLAARNFAKAARAAGVERIIYLGGLGDPSDDLSPHLRSRQDTGRELAAYGLPLLEFRAGIILGAGSASFRMLWDLVHRLPLMVAPRWVRTRAQPIAVADVVSYLDAGRKLDLPEQHTVIEIGGADILGYKQMLEGLARHRGLRRTVITVPVLTPRLSSLWCAFVTSVPLSIARPLIDGVRNEVVVRDDVALKLFPDISPVGFMEAIRLAEREVQED